MYYRRKPGNAGQARTTMVSDSARNGQPRKELTNGSTVKGNHGYRWCKYIDQFRSHKDYL